MEQRREVEQEIVAQLKPLLGGAPVRDGYEVQAHAVA